MDVPANPPGLPTSPASGGELVVRNGRRIGTRLSLVAPLILIGEAAACDLRLEATDAAPLHCALVLDRAGPLLRDLGHGTRVNGQPVQTHRLSNGDVIEIGSVQLAVQLDSSTTCELPSADLFLAEQERDALRIQAAAVAAQQAALTEEEARLLQRATGLERQETQLASHLEERQQRLDEQHEALKEERAAFKAESAATRESLDTERRQLSGEQKELRRQLEQAVQQRQHLAEFRRRLWRRYQRLGKEREAALKRRQAEVESEAAQLQRDRDAARATIERVNGELEIGRCELREEWQALGLQQQEWEAALNFEQDERQRQIAELTSRAAAVVAAEEALAAAKQAWRQGQALRMREAEGLEARVLNLRAGLEMLQEAANRRPGHGLPPEAPPPPPLSPALQPARVTHREALPARVNTLAGLLLDQRSHLAEQWQQLVEVQERWQEERRVALEELQEAGERLNARERELAAAEGRLKLLDAEGQRRQENNVRLRLALEGRQSRLEAERGEWLAHREELLTQVEERERLAQRRREQLDEVQQRRNRQRKRELTELHLVRNRCDEARRQYSQLWQECEGLRDRLSEQERVLSGKAMALDRYRQELVNQAPDSARADNWIERLGKREANRLEVEARAVRVERNRLLAERSRLNDDLTQLRRLEEELAARQQEWVRQVAEWERQRATSEEELLQREQEAARYQAQHAIAERQLRSLREELERLARALIEEAIDPRAQAQAA